MRFLLAAVAAALLASNVGCQSMKSSGCGDPCGCTAPCHISQSQNAPRPLIGRTACGPPGATQCCYDGCGQGCGDGCCGCGSGCCSGSCCNGNNFGCLSSQANGCVNGLVNAALGDPSCCPCGPGDSVYDFQPGPPAAQTAYPYYTTRGPRDFLMARPPSIGPGSGYNCR